MFAQNSSPLSLLVFLALLNALGYESNEKRKASFSLKLNSRSAFCCAFPWWYEKKKLVLKPYQQAVGLLKVFMAPANLLLKVHEAFRSVLSATTHMG